MKSPHWPALDGLRGLAILLVVAGHMGFAPPAAGAMGVTAFFVLSGFLITNVLLGRESGLIAFYGARAVRLVPALAVTVAGVVVIWLVQGRPAPQIAEEALTSLFYVENFFIVRHGLGVMAHTWSLSVEEQFYLLWPFLLPLVLLVRRRALLLWALVALGIVVRAVMLKTIDPLHSYASLPSNAYALLMGCLLAIAPWTFRLRIPTLVLGFAGVAFAVLAAPFVPGYLVGAAPVAALGAMLLIHAGQQGSALLSWAPLRFAGRISYAWYLWHWPLLWLSGTTFGRLESIPMVLVSLGLAIGSTLWIEEPLRRAWRARSRDRAPVTAGQPVTDPRAEPA